VKFGISFGDSPYTRSIELVQQADECGFDQAWAWDSHIIWQDFCTVLGRISGMTRLQMGTCVTQPQTRDPTVIASVFATLNQMSAAGLPVICGIGRGDSSVRLMKRRPANLAALEEAINIIRTLGSGGTIEINGVEVKIPWASGTVPIYVAGYGPKALQLAGRVGDGVIFQIADPYVIEWGMRWVRKGAEDAGRDLTGFQVQCATASTITDDRESARQQTRWFPAVVGNHIADVLRHHDPEDLPDELIDYVKNRSAYDYREHTEPGSEHSNYVPDGIVDRFCIIGTRDECAAKLRVLADVGVTELNLYPHVENILDDIATYGREIAPEFQSARVG
jgi:probable F420-dependent oxidoreductase